MYKRLIRTIHRSGLRLFHANLLDVSALFCTSLLLVRITATSVWTFGFLFWNLFLAYCPLLILYAVSRWPVIWEHKLLRVLVKVCWLLMLPNAFYMVTDLLHISEFPNMPRWYDLVMLFSFAWTGLLSGVLAMSRMEVLLLSAGSWLRKVWLRVGLILLVAVGVYLGRQLRFNSWDFFTRPAPLISELLDLFKSPLLQREAWSTILLHAGLYFIVYRSLLPLMYLEFTGRRSVSGETSLKSGDTSILKIDL